MDGATEQENPAEALHVLSIEAEFEARVERVRRLGRWAAALMNLAHRDTDRYQEILHRLAISSLEERAIFDRVHDDLAATGVLVSRARVREMYENFEVTW